MLQVDWQSSFRGPEGAVGSRQGSGSVIIPNDHVQQLLRRKLLNISTARQMDSDQSVVKIVSDSCSSTLMPQAKPVRKVRYALPLRGTTSPYWLPLTPPPSSLPLELQSAHHVVLDARVAAGVAGHKMLWGVTDTVARNNHSHGACKTTYIQPNTSHRCNLSRTSRRSLLGFSKPVLFEMFSMKGKVKLLAERESGQHLGFSILSPPAGSTSQP